MTRKATGCKFCGKPSGPYTTCWTCWGEENGVDADTIAEWQAEDRKP